MANQENQQVNSGFVPSMDWFLGVERFMGTTQTGLENLSKESERLSDGYDELLKKATDAKAVDDRADVVKIQQANDIVDTNAGKEEAKVWRNQFFRLLAALVGFIVVLFVVGGFVLRAYVTKLVPVDINNILKHSAVEEILPDSE
jgi:flagellar biosynthesis/type III secretory pathway M-ring protein FliF/YscJ